MSTETENVFVLPTVEQRRKQLIEKKNAIVEERTRCVVNYIDDLSDNKQHIKIASLKGLISLFQKTFFNFHPNVLNLKWLLQFCRSALNMGTQEEKNLSLQVLSLLVVQNKQLADRIRKDYLHTVHSIISDNSNSDNFIRNALLLLGSIHLFSNDIDEAEHLKSIELVFEHINLLVEASRNIVQLEDEKLLMLVTTFDCWALLLTLLSDDNVLWASFSMMNVAVDLLECHECEIRKRCGRCVALIYETVFMKLNETYEFENHNSVVEQITRLGSTTTKKKKMIKCEKIADIKEYNDILKSIQSSGEYYSTSEIWLDSKKSTSLMIDSWKKEFYYHYLCWILEDGIMFHLRENELIHSLLDYGYVESVDFNIVDTTEKAMEKKKRQLQKKMVSKFRHLYKEPRMFVVESDEY